MARVLTLDDWDPLQPLPDLDDVDRINVPPSSKKFWKKQVLLRERLKRRLRWGGRIYSGDRLVYTKRGR